jgi:4'-phosphopantetheinyl transferase
MIHWLIQSAEDHPDLARGVAPSGLLTQAEQQRMSALKADKRRRDWLLGRWTAKCLLQSLIEQQTGLRPRLDAFAIDTDPSGAPMLDVRCWSIDYEPNLTSKIQDLQLSISHSSGRAFCALSDGANVGADIEHIEPRAWRFVDDYFTPSEILHVRRAPAVQRDTLITAIWSAKEAALKALRLGLSVDTRSVACDLAAEQEGGWADIAFIYDERRLGQVPPAMTGWWRRIDNFVLTVATTHSELPR